jgi:hypothetical protein
MARVILNKIRIGNKVNGALTQPRFAGLARNAANTRFISAKLGTLNDFNDSEITKELKAGAKAENSVLGYGNLAAFLGLEDSNKSVTDLHLFLQNRLDFDKSQSPKFVKNNSGVVYEFKVKAPTLQEIYDAFPPPPKSYNKSWVEMIEKGYGTFARFVFRLLGFPKSRSGTGIQRKTNRKWMKVDSSSPSFKWISKILTDFRAKFSR